MYLLILILGITMAICVCSGDVAHPAIYRDAVFFWDVYRNSCCQERFLGVSILGFHGIDTKKILHIMLKVKLTFSLV